MQYKNVPVKFLKSVLLPAAAVALVIFSFFIVLSPVKTLAEPTTTEEIPFGVEAECKPAEGEELTTKNCGILYFIQAIINVLTAFVGVVVVIMLIVGGIQYSASRGDPAAVQGAKQKITSAVTALILFVFIWAFLQWAVPGGVF